MIWYVFCYTGYKLPEHRIISVKHLKFIPIDSEKRYNTRERFMVTSVQPAPGSIHHYGEYMNFDEIVPVQFYPRPLSLGKYFGLEYSANLRLNQHMLDLLTCKTDKDPMKHRVFV